MSKTSTTQMKSREAKIELTKQCLDDVKALRSPLEVFNNETKASQNRIIVLKQFMLRNIDEPENYDNAFQKVLELAGDLRERKLKSESKARADEAIYQQDLDARAAMLMDHIQDIFGPAAVEKWIGGRSSLTSRQDAIASTGPSRASTSNEAEVARDVPPPETTAQASYGDNASDVSDSSRVGHVGECAAVEQIEEPANSIDDICDDVDIKTAPSATSEKSASPIVHPSKRKANSPPAAAPSPKRWRLLVTLKVPQQSIRVASQGSGHDSQFSSALGSTRSTATNRPASSQSRFDDCIEPIPGNLYTASRAGRQERWAVIVLSRGDFDGRQNSGFFKDSTLLQRPPPCYVCDGKSTRIIAYQKGFEDGGPLVSQRQFPVMYIDCGKDPFVGSFAWVQAKDLKPYDPNDSTVRRQRTVQLVLKRVGIATAKDINHPLNPGPRRHR